MMLRKRILALLLTAICLLGILPLSVSAYTPAVAGATYFYEYLEPTFSHATITEPILTPILGELHYLLLEGSPDNIGTATVDILASEIISIGYFKNEYTDAVSIEVNLNGVGYIPVFSPYPIYFENQSATITFYRHHSDSKIIAQILAPGTELRLYISPNSELSFTLIEILDSTDMDILNIALEAFSTELTTDNYVDWMLGGYNGIIDVFVNNAKIQYVMDNPVFIIALVVFAMAIAFAVATFIFKIFRRY